MKKSVTDLRTGECLWVDHFGVHVAVVIRIECGLPVAVFGTSQPKTHVPNTNIPIQADEFVDVDPSDAEGPVLGLNKLTHFYAYSIDVLSPNAKISRVCTKRCPPGLFRKLEYMAKLAAARSAAVAAAPAAGAVPAPAAAAPAVDVAPASDPPSDDLVKHGSEADASTTASVAAKGRGE